MFGLGLIVASACVTNNYIDRNIDKKMSRTKNRALAAGTVSIHIALIYAVLLFTIGLLTLALSTNTLSVLLALFAWFSYVVVYGIAKRHSVHGTLVGTIPGALPPVIGYIAVTNTIDKAGIILFLSMVFWQMAHFYAIAMFRHKDYEAAGLPVITVVRGMSAAKKHIIAYIPLYTASLITLTVFGYTGYIYLIGVVVAGLYWFYYGVSHWSLKDSIWGKKMFHNSLIATLAMSILIALGARLP